MKILALILSIIFIFPSVISFFLLSTSLIGREKLFSFPNFEYYSLFLMSFIWPLNKFEEYLKSPFDQISYDGIAFLWPITFAAFLLLIRYGRTFLGNIFDIANVKFGLACYLWLSVSGALPSVFFPGVGKFYREIPFCLVLIGSCIPILPCIFLFFTIGFCGKNKSTLTFWIYLKQWLSMWMLWNILSLLPAYL